MLKIINFINTGHKRVLVYEWDNVQGDICTDAQVFEEKTDAYKYWKHCCRTYVQQKIDKLRNITKQLNQTEPRWAKDCWQMFDIDFAKINIDEFKIKTNTTLLEDKVNKLKQEAKQILIEFTKVLSK